MRRILLLLAVATFLVPSIPAVVSAGAIAQSVQNGDWGNASTWDIGEPIVGFQANIGHVVDVTLPGEVAGFVVVGIPGVGTLNVQSGDLTVGSGIDVGAASAGTLNLSGGTLGIGNRLTVAHSSNGSLTVSGGALNSGQVWVGNAVNGVMTVEGGSATINVGSTEVRGTSSIVIRPTGNGAAGLSTIANTGAVTVDANTTLELDDALYTPKYGDEWVVLTGTGISGPFGTLVPPPGYTIEQDLTVVGQLTIRVTGTPGPPALAQTNVIYATQGGAGDTLVTIDPTTGATTVIGKSGLNLPGLAVSPSGELFATTRTGPAGTDPARLYRIDAETAEPFPVGNTGVFYLDAIAFDRDGTLWGLGDAGQETLYEINTTTAAVTPVGPTFALIGGFAIDPTDGTAYASGGSGNQNIYKVDLSTGTLGLIGATGFGTGTPDIAFDVHGRLYGVFGSGGGGGGGGAQSIFFAIDKASGIGNPIGLTDKFGLSGMASQAFLNRAQVGVIYGTQGNAGDQLMTIWAPTGVGSPVANLDYVQMSGLAINPQGDLFGTHGAFANGADSLYRVDALTGDMYLVGYLGVQFMDAIAFDQAGNLWGLGNAGFVSLYSIDPTNAGTTLIGPTGEQLAGLAVDPTNDSLYASTGGNFENVSEGIYSVNRVNGAITLIGTLGGVTSNGAVQDLAFDLTGQLYGVIGSGGGGSGGASSRWVRIDKSNGAGVVVGSVGYSGVSGLASWVFGPTVDVPTSGVPAVGSLDLAARPNPFTGSTELRFALAREGTVEIDVFNVTGQRVVQLMRGVLPAGSHTVRWAGIDDDGRPVGSGVYFVQMRRDDGTGTRTLVKIQ